MSFLKVVKATSLLVLLSGAIACSPSAKEAGQEKAHSFKLGKDYELVRDTPSAKPQIIEHFSLYCGHCYNTEPLIKSMKKSLAKDVDFKRSHVIFLPQQRPEWGKAMTFGVAAAQELNVEEGFVEAVFDSHFKQKKYLGDYSHLVELFSGLGVDAAKFKETMNSEATLERVREMVNKANSDKVRFTPDLIVNDKYRVMINYIPVGAEANEVTPEQQLDNLIEYLLTNP
ncbi:thiol:disulfide interchange protein DsbA/DsbL [Psychrobium sp. MM17-31]|uniref:thiol:disulfide interchange protein DsbA/DsbL n=1 Tax=Psychrobium sp. MM17-31 TaxID=2917758 RepID=UPI001EF5B3C7|nr:thiol:disulfide interchange protein DsbA/DsbL [Psychrobium sp. MM17-31]MCG7532107.1 thiol:disulfide interchange protein DsbA/DsbL [Psychrobium sp. MM17-31]